MFSKIIIILTIVSSVSFAKQDPETISRSLTREMVQILIRSKDIRLTDSMKGCKDIEGPPLTKNYLLGDYLSFLVSSLDVNFGQSGLTSACKPKAKSRECEVMFRTGVGTNSPWSYGLQFEVNSDGKILAESIRCPGAS